MARKKEYPLRIDDDLWQEIQAWAADELRSANAQIEYILRRAVSHRRRDLGPRAEPNVDEAQEPDPQ
jgi:hypothetical protein